MTATLRRWTSPMRFTYANDARPIDGFTIRRGIHRGGFGEVYYAVSDAGKEVALKLLTHDLDTELRGIRQCLNLKHPNLVTIFDVKSDRDGDHWVVMEYVNGSNLEEVLTAFPQGLPLSEVRDWMHGLVAGVEYLHDRGLIHRDLKPANIYRENGVVKVGDVGLSKRFDGERRHQHTESIGTVYYMAPEITHGKYGPQVDVYSLGIILYELLTGRLPFNGETSGEILMKQLSAAPDLSLIAANLRPVLEHALEKDPQKRTPSVRQLWYEFEQSLAPATAIPDTHFVNGHAHASPLPVNSARRDTDKSRDTDHRHRVPVKAVNHPRGGSDPSIPRQMGRAVGRARTNPWVTMAIIAVAIWASIVPWHRFGRIQARIAVPVALLVGGYLLVRKLRSPAQETVALTPPAPKAVDPHVVPVSVVRNDPPPQPPVAPSPPAPPPPKVKNDWFGSLATGAIASICFSAIALMLMATFQHRPLLIERTEQLVFFAAVAVFGTWGVIGSRWLADRLSWAADHCRLLHAAAGVAVATVADSLQHFLMLDAIGPDNRNWERAAFDHVGVNPLVMSHEMTWVGYVVFFSLLFFILGKQLVKVQKPGRKHRWMLWSLVYPVLASLVLVHVFAFPQLMGVLWAATIVSAAQFAAPWQPSVKFAGKR